MNLLRVWLLLGKISWLEVGASVLVSAIGLRLGVVAPAGRTLPIARAAQSTGASRILTRGKCIAGLPRLPPKMHVIYRPLVRVLLMLRCSARESESICRLC